VGRPEADNEVDVIGRDRQFLDVPVLLGALGLNELAAVRGDVPNQDRLPPFGTPNEVVDNQVNAVFVSLLFHANRLPAIDVDFKMAVEKRMG
jgi:hypothetical protein